MKAGKRPQSQRTQKSFGLVANGSAGAWRVDIDETLSGTQRWFAQIEGPTCYLYFEIDHPQAVVKIARFLSNNVHEENGSHAQNRELKVGNAGGHTVEFLWDRDPADRCFILLRGENEFCVRTTLLRDDLQSLQKAVEQVCEALREDGLVAES
jgi:hypothetical protein